MLRAFLAAALALLVLAAVADPAFARNRHHHHQAPVCVDLDAMRPCQGKSAAGRPRAVARGALFRHGRHIAAAVSGSSPGASPGTGRMLSHPAGCPARAFCGCGAAVRVFGAPRRDLWLAAAWFRFPRAAPGAGMVAVRRHHVFVLERPLEGGAWLVYDANSGGHATRLHARSLAGYVIVNPRGAG